jgi:glyoxylase-like metal-dependent hydrolase (beta-lactamase superfamily II)
MKKTIITFLAVFAAFACVSCNAEKAGPVTEKAEEANEMIISTYVLTEHSSNCYLLCDEKNKEACLIDPGAYDQGIMDFIAEKELVCQYIILTHGHFDHIIGAEAFKQKTGAKIAAHELEAEYLADPEKSMTFYFDSETVSADVLFKDGDLINFGDFSLRVIHTPGHSKGSSCFVYENGDQKIMFTGDTLFKGTIGRFDFYGGDYDTLMASLEKLKSLKENYKIYSGHGEATFLDDEIARNPYYAGIR